MWTGRQTLASIENAIAGLHQEESQLDASLRSAIAEAERLRKERSDSLRELARIKLDEMAAGRLVGDLDAGERRAVQVLDDYRRKVAATGERRDTLLKEVAAAEAERHSAATAVEAALEAVEALRAQAEAQVQAQAEWKSAKAAFDEADAVASEAEKKAAGSEAELGAKKKPYDEDPLFTYLWRRKFGTSQYAGGNIARMLDRMVADFIGFADVRANYAALIEIPLRLREHATAQRTAAGGRQEALSVVERRAMVAAGVEAKEEVLAAARNRLAAADATVDGKHGALRTVDEERNALVAAGTDPTYNEALSTIATADSTDDIATLYREARRTPTTADENVVRKIEAIDASVARADAETAGLRRSAQDLARRRLEVEQVRDRFRNAGYDHPHTTFGNEADIADVLKGVLAGAMRSGVLWDLLRQGYGYRAPRSRPDFGAPSLPFPFPIPGGGTIGSSGGGWRVPTTRGGWSPGSGTSGGSREGDDDQFTTGGSF